MSEAAEAENHEFLAVRELAELLRVKERKVHDLAASGEVPCARVTGKLLFPKDSFRAWIAGASSARAFSELPAIFLGSSAGTARSESDSVADVAAGCANAAVGLRALAEQHRLGFVMFIKERFDILFDCRAWFEPQMQRLAVFRRGVAFRAHAAAMPRDHIAECLQVRWNT